MIFVLTVGCVVLEAHGQASSGLPSPSSVYSVACSDTSGSATTQVCNTTPSFTLAAGNCISYNTTTANTGALTINVNGSGAKTVQKWLGTALASGDMPANKTVDLCYDGTNLQVMTIGNAPGGSGTVTTTGSPASGQLSKFSGATSITTATAHDVANALVCADSSGSGTAQSCSTSPTYTPAAGDWIIYTTTTANTGTGLTLNVNSLGAKSVAKWQGSTTLAANDVLANKYVLATYDGTNWELATIGNAPSGGGSGTNVQVNGGSTLTTSNQTGVLPYVCSDSSGSATAQSCTTTPSFTPTAGNCISYNTTTANTGALTLNVDSSAADAVQKWLGTALASGDMPANKSVPLCFDGSHWQMMTIGNVPSASGAVSNITSSITWTGCTVSNGVCTVGSAVASLTAASIPSTYNEIRVVISGHSSGTNDTGVIAQFNGDTTAGDYTCAFGGYSAGNLNTTCAAVSISFAYVTCISITGDSMGGGSFNIVGYANAAKQETTGTCGRQYSSGLAAFISTNYWQPATAAAINAIKLTLTGGDNFSTDVAVSVYGIGAGTVPTGPVVPTFTGTRTFVSENSSSLASITSPAKTIAVGDVVAVACRGGTNTITSATVTDSNSNTWTNASHSTFSNNPWIQVSFSKIATGGSTTFTCTPNASSQFMSMVVLDLGQWTATTPSDIGSISSSGGASTSWTSGLFSTTAKSFALTCATFGSTAGSFVTNQTLGVPSALLGISTTNLFGTDDMGCEASLVPYPVTGGNSTLQYSTSAAQAGVSVGLAY